MKAKMKFDTAKLKEFFIAHGEKYAIDCGVRYPGDVRPLRGGA